MKRTFLTLALAIMVGATADAGTKNKCCKTETSACSPCGTAGWYKAKDGTYREMLPYWKALSRAEDADDMEPVLKKTQEELAASKAETEAARNEAAKMKSDLEAQIAELQKQLESEKQAVASQKERADKAEAAHKLCIEQVATLRDAAKKNEETLAGVRTELKSAIDERDALKGDKAQLEKQLADASEKITATQQEVEKLKQEAAESKKAQVEEDKSDKEEPKPEGDQPAEGDKGGEPATPEAGNQ